ncbi:hypothetical protein [Saccharopolyspora flava]|uniref:4-amino-4-deoxy-L-arabinose transferase n=1 Tax=Saccharopolyspora flava TaxID=95161 RepID=A0A1I6PPU6_9PSEU|nr:hypothetical protein [Saccharopolyspora flava]SFS42088.1 hypothetical protein SAMN05660874_00984 [Saccharopolyspora flava]
MWWVAAGAVVLAGLVFWLVKDALLDDSYITLSYARGVVERGEWGMIPGEVANSATSPGNVLLLTLVAWVVGSPVRALGVVFTASAVVLVLALRRAALDRGLPGWTGVVTAALVGLNPLLLSTVGLEMTLAAALLAVLLAAVTGSRPWLFGITTGALALTRLDLGVFVLVAVVCCPRLWRGWWKWFVAAVVVAGPWFVFSWFHFGSAVPDTLVIKQLQEAWGEYSFGNGLGMLHELAPEATVVALLPAVCGVLAAVVLAVLAVLGRGRRAWPWAVLGTGGAAHFLVYSQLGVPPYHWYYAPSFIATTIAFGGLLGLVASRVRWRLPVALVGAVLVVPSLWVVGGQGLPWRTAPIETNWGSAADYARIGTEVGRRVGDATVTSPGELGTLAYFCRCRVVDGFSDRGYLGPEIAERIDRAGPLTAALLRLNYRHFQPTEPREIDYLLRVADGPGPDPFWTISTPLGPPKHLTLEPASP